MSLALKLKHVVSKVCERSLVAALCRDDKVDELHLRVRSNTKRGRQDLISSKLKFVTNPFGAASRCDSFKFRRRRNL